ncbi:MAG: hypothetical protein WBS20_07685 [Lysobacterales bacterium]
MPRDANTRNNSQNEAESDDNVLISAAQLVLAEKRTSLSLMRTGIAVFALPMAVFSALIATSRYYNASDVLHLFIPVMVINSALIVLGAYLVIKAAVRIRRQDHLITKIKRTHPLLAPYID